MRFSLLSIAASALLLGACTTGAAHAHGENNAAGASDTATSFITPGHAVPDSARRGSDGVPRDASGRPHDYAHLGRTLPAFSGSMLDGTAFASQALEGQWTLIEVWGVWCHDSRNDAPYVDALWERIEGRPDLGFLSIHVPQNAETAANAYGRYGSVEAFLADEGYDWPVLTDKDASIREALTIRWTPSYILVAPDLTVQGYRTDLSTSGDEDPVTALLDQIETVSASYDPGRIRPVED